MYLNRQLPFRLKIEAPPRPRWRIDGLYCTVKVAVLLVTDCVLTVFFEPELKPA